MSNYFNMKLKNKYNNIWDIEETLFTTNENCFTGIYEITYVFYNDILKYSLVYHKKMFDNNDYMELYTNACMIKDVIRDYWNKDRIEKIVDKLRDVNISDKVNMILDEMDNLIEEKNKVFLDFLGMVKNELPAN